MKLARAQAWWATALAAVALASCRFGYEPLGLLSSNEGGTTAFGGDAPSGNGPFGGAPGAVAGSAGTDGGTSSTQDGGTGGVLEVGGMTGGAGSAGAGQEPSTCIPDASCSCDAFDGHDYRFCGVLAVRDAGLVACQSANLGLIRVDSAEENAWLLQRFIEHDMFMGSGSSIVILGGVDTQVGTTWSWHDGTVFWDGAPVDGLYTNWSAPPKASQGNCLGMTSDGTWVSRSCNSGNATVACESR